MAKVLTGVLLRAEDPRIKRGEVWFRLVEFESQDGTRFTWKDLSMSREVADVLRLGQPVTLYVSPALSSLFGVRVGDGTGVFSAQSANPLFMVMAVGMIFLGLGTSMFLFPILIALAGVSGLVLHFQAASAKRLYRREERRLRAAAGTQH